MAMPEATVDEYDDAVSPKDNIWSTGQVSNVYAETIAKSVEHRPNG
jgi:hypothetical protein